MTDDPTSRAEDGSEPPAARNRRYRAIVESAVDFAMIATDREGRITDWNSGAERILGWSAAEIRGQPADRFFTPEDQAGGRVAAEMRVALADGRASDDRWHMRRDGTRFWASGEMMPLRDEAGAHLGYLKILRDRTERRRAEEAFRQALGMNALILNSSRDCIVVLDLDGHTQFVSPGGIEGMEIEDVGAILGLSWLRVWQGADHAAAIAAVAAAREGGIGRFQGFCPTHKGTPKWWDVVVSPLPGADGRPERLVSVGRDITGQRTAERRQRVLLDLGDRLRDLDDTAEMAYAAAELLGTTLGVSRAGYGTIDPALETISIERDWNAPGISSLAGVLHFRDYGSYIDDLKRGELVVFADAETDPRTAATAAALEAISARAVLNLPVTESGGFVALLYLNNADAHHWTDQEIALVRDVADRTRSAIERRRAEASLQTLNATLEQRVEERTRERDRAWKNSRDLQAVLDTHGVFQAANDAWMTILGWRPDEVVGRGYLDFIHPDDQPSSETALASASVEELQVHENRYRHRDGSWRWISWVAAPEQGLIYASGRHVTAEKEARAELEATQDKLRQSQKMEAVGQLTGGVAHDFNNLLTGIIGSLELMQSRVAQGRLAEVDRYVGAAHGAARRAASLTQRLLAFSRQQTLDPQPTNVNRLIADMEELIRRTVGPAVQTEVVGAGGLWVALIDRNQLENALLNLCINARDAMQEGGRLTIETANKWLDGRAATERDLPPGQYVCLCVTDTGSGMMPVVAARAFDPFFTTKRLGEGTGLGLSMVYGFVRQSGGQVRIYSEPGRGTTMKLYLPRHLGPAGDADEAPPPPRSRGDSAGQTVLVVDDEPTVRMLIAEVLAEAGYTAIEAADGAAGVAVLRSGARIDLLITDVGLPGGMNGRQVADAGRAARPGLKVLFITGYAENAVIGNGHLEPGTKVLTKPFAMQSLAETLREMLGAG